MKITNTSTARLTLNITFENLFGNFLNVTIAPGQIVFAEDNQLTKSAIIQQRKQNIEIEECEKPFHVNYYVAYEVSQLEVGLLAKVGKTIKNLFVNEEPMSQEADPLATIEDPYEDSEEIKEFKAPDEPTQVAVSESDQKMMEKIMSQEPKPSEEALQELDKAIESLGSESVNVVEENLEPIFDEPELPVVETELNKKKGRPKGAKNKPKRGRPRGAKKRPSGPTA